jgi:hypothetical protein
MRRMLSLVTVLLAACGEPAAPVTPPSSTPAPSTAAPTPEAPATPEAPTPAPTVSGGEVQWFEEDTPTLLVPIDPLPQPDVPVFGRYDLHHAWRLVRVIDEVPAPAHAIIVDTFLARTCEARITRARRVHTLLVLEDDSFNGEAAPIEPLTFLALDFEGCEGSGGFTGISLSDVHVRSLRLDALSEPATPELIEAVRHVDDDIWGRDPMRSDAFRMLDLPAHGVTVVVGNAGWLLRDGLVLLGGEPIAVVEAGPHISFHVQTVSEDWFAPLAAAYVPRYVPAECEVIDDSGSAMNLRAGPRGNATVVGTVPAGARVTANDMNGSWFHVASPPGWAHQRGLRCPQLVPAPY